jgi:predicted MFS family arabinose efflux permease
MTPRRGLIIACGLALGMAVANSFARFAYALILPAMKADLAWSYTEAGSLNTTNAVGYLVGSLIAFRTVRRMGLKRPFIAGLWFTAFALLATGLTRDFYAISILRFLAGIACAYVFIAGSVLAASIFPDDVRRSALAITIYFGGGGFGLLLSGLILPGLFAQGHDGAWPIAWIVLGALSIVASLLATLAAAPIQSPAAQRTPHPWRKTPLVALFLAYGCFALGYFAYMTFIVAWMREHGYGPVDVTMVWSVLGLATMIAPRIWSRPMARWSGGKPLAAVMGTIGIGAVLPVMFTTLPAMLASAALFGMFFMTPASITAFIKKALAPPVWGEAVAAFTLFFSLLQCVGPVVTGLLADLTGSLAAGLGISAGVLFLGAALALLQPDRTA